MTTKACEGTFYTQIIRIFESIVCTKKVISESRANSLEKQQDLTNADCLRLGHYFLKHKHDLEKAEALFSLACKKDSEDSNSSLYLFAFKYAAYAAPKDKKYNAEKYILSHEQLFEIASWLSNQKDLDPRAAVLLGVVTTNLQHESCLLAKRRKYIALTDGENEFIRRVKDLANVSRGISLSRYSLALNP